MKGKYMHLDAVRIKSSFPLLSNCSANVSLYSLCLKDFREPGVHKRCYIARCSAVIKVLSFPP